MLETIKVTPKRVRKTNGTVLTHGMSITVTRRQHTFVPFYNGAKEPEESEMRLYGFSYQRACCNKNNFEIKQLN
jgi:hypothetical protein